MSTEMEVYNPQEAEYTPLTEREAQKLNNKIKTACDKMNTSREGLWDLLDEAAKGQIHVALGYASWTAWWSETVEIRPLDVADRKELARMMASKGMSTRAGAKALGYSQSGFSRDTKGESSNSDTVTSLDGSQRQRSKPSEDEEELPVQDAAEESEEPAEEPIEPLRPVSEDFQDEMYNLANWRSAIGEILEDERILVLRTRNSLAKKHVDDLQDAANHIQAIIDFLRG